MKQQEDLVGKVIVITGANGGLGRALAKRFAEDGDVVMLLGRSLSKVTEVAGAIGGATHAIACEVSSPDSVRAAFSEIEQLHPRIDVLINNAAVYKPVVFEEASDSDILDAVLANLAGPMFCARSAIPLLARGGHIINISSESVEDSSFPHLIPYQSSKGGLERFSQHLARELEDRAVRVTTVRAGAMVGPGSSTVMDPVAGARFFDAATARGLHLMTRGFTSYQSTLDLFRILVDSPPDIKIGLVSFQGRPVD
jgi:meso-butanediol dehydrogenase/(S,S)-butanediol dehydrogenase/diacetyl reductase